MPGIHTANWQRRISWLVALFSFVLLLCITPRGIGASPDSAVYLGASRSLVAGQGLVVPFGARLGEPLSGYPPFYPLVLAAFSALTGLEWGPRLLQAGLFAVNLLLLGQGLRQVTSGGTRRSLNPLAGEGAGWAPLLGMFLFLSAPIILELHAMAWSEALFLTCMLAAWVTFNHFRRQDNLWGVLWSAPFIALACLTRYAGAALLLSTVACVFWSGKGRWGVDGWRKRLLPAVLLGGLSGLPLVFWLLFQPSTALGNRELVFHPLGMKHLYQLIFTLSGWLQIPAVVPTWGKIILLALLVAGGLGLWWCQPRMEPDHEKPGDAPSARGSLAPYLVFPVVYFAFLVFSISWVDANTPLDNRILAPVWVCALLLLVYALTQLRFERPAARWLLLLVLAGFTVASLVASVRFGSTAWRDGLGFNSRSWQEADVVAWLQDADAGLAAGTAIYTNVPAGIYLNTSRPALALPRARFATTQQANPDYASEIKELAASLAAGQALVVYFTNLPSSSSVEEQGLLADLGLCLLHGSSTGGVDELAASAAGVITGNIYTAGVQPCLKP